MGYNSKLEQTNRKVARAKRKYYGSFDYGSGTRVFSKGGTFSFAKTFKDGGPRYGDAIATGVGIVGNALADSQTDLSYVDWAMMQRAKEQALASSLFGADDNSGLLTALDNAYLTGPELRTFDSSNGRQNFAKIATAAGTGAVAGSMINTGIGTLVGAAAGALTEGAGILGKRLTAKANVRKGTALTNDLNVALSTAKAQAIDATDTRNDLMRQKLAMDTVNYGAFGGPITHGVDFNNGLTFINAGGSHEANPNEGVPIGLDDEGIPNLVEEGEVIWDNDYVFSNRTKITKELAKKYGLGGDLSFADAIKEVTKESEMRPNDPISNATNKAIVEEFMEVQEGLRQKEQIQAAKEYNDALDAQFMEQLAMMPQAAPEEQGMNVQVPQEYQQEPYPMQDESMMPPGYAKGGHLFEKGGSRGDTLPEGMSVIRVAGSNVPHHWTTSDGLSFSYRTAKERERVYQKALKHQKELNDKALEGAEPGVIVKWDNGKPYYVTSDGSHVGTLEGTNAAQKSINSSMPTSGEIEAATVTAERPAKKSSASSASQKQESKTTVSTAQTANTAAKQAPASKAKATTPSAVKPLSPNQSKLEPFDYYSPEVASALDEDYVNQLTQDELAQLMSELGVSTQPTADKEYDGMLTSADEYDEDLQNSKLYFGRQRPAQPATVSPDTYSGINTSADDEYDEALQYDKVYFGISNSRPEIKNVNNIQSELADFNYQIPSVEDINRENDALIADTIFGFTPNENGITEEERRKAINDELRILDRSAWEKSHPTVMNGTPKPFVVNPNKKSAIEPPQREHSSNATSFDLERDLPIIASGLAAGYGIMSSPDYSNVEPLFPAAQALGTPVSIPVETIGDYVQTRPFDERYLVNRAVQARNAAYRGSMDTSGGNRAMQLGAQSYLAGAYQNNLAEIMRQAYLANRQDAMTAAEFNRGTNLQNMSAINARNTTQAQLNSHRQQAGYSALASAYGMKQGIRDAWDNATQTALNTFIRNVGTRGKETADRNMAISLADLMGSPITITAQDIYDLVASKKAQQKKEPNARGGKLKKKRRF